MPHCDMASGRTGLRQCTELSGTPKKDIGRNIKSSLRGHAVRHEATIATRSYYLGWEALRPRGASHLWRNGWSERIYDLRSGSKAGTWVKIASLAPRNWIYTFMLPSTASNAFKCLCFRCVSRFRAQVEIEIYNGRFITRYLIYPVHRVRRGWASV